MKRIVIAPAVMLLLVALAAQAQTAPTPEHKKLGVFIGTWTTEVKIEADSPDKGKTYKGTNVCTWFTGEYQVICDSEGSGFAGTRKSHSIYGYSEEKKQYFYFSITSAGESPLMLTGRVDGSVWTWEFSNTEGDKTIQGRVVVTFASPNEYTVKSEYSEDGKNWILTAEGKASMYGFSLK
jgi:hypothetical protein